MIITSTWRAPLGLPSGVTLEPGVPTVVHGWDQDMKSRIVQAWVKSGILKVGNGQKSQFVSEPEPLPEPERKQEQPETEAPKAEVADEKTELLAALEAKGIKADKRTGIKKLKSLLAES